MDGSPLSGFSNKDAVEILKMTGSKVKLKLCRYLKSLNFEQQHVTVQTEDLTSEFNIFSCLQDDGVYRLTTVPDRVVLTQDTAAHCNMSLSSTNMSPVTPAKVRFIDGSL